LTLRTLEALAADDTLTPDEFQTAKARHIEMHGSIFQTTCMQCKHAHRSYDMPLASAFQDHLLSDEELKSATHSDDDGEKLPLELLPRCGGPSWNGSNRYGRCGGPLRPRIVWFGEMPEGMGEIARALNWTDVLIVVGTSALVRLPQHYDFNISDNDVCRCIQQLALSRQ
jgi:NAD-dependent deacetylase sirtuin 5